METDQNTTPLASGERPLEPLSQRKYLKVNTSLPHLVKDSEKVHEPYFKSLFHGRINRRNYFWGTLLIIFAPLAGALILYLNTYLLTPTATSNAPLSSGLQQRSFIPDPAVIIPRVITPIGVFLSVVGVLMGLPYLISMQVRRLHDINTRGFVGLLLLLPPITFFLLLYLLFRPGVQGENAYGTQPLARTNVREDVFKLQENRQ